MELPSLAGRLEAISWQNQNSGKNRRETRPMRPLILLLSIATLLAGQQKADQPDWQQWLTQGIDAYKAGNYSQALALLQKTIDQKPDDIKAHSFLASTCLALYVPGDTSSKNLDLAKRAEASFTRVAELFS